MNNHQFNSFHSAFLCLFLISCIGAIGCHSQKDAGGERRYELRGKVVAVDLNNREATIAHQKIEGYMDAMTMSYAIKDDLALKELTPGDDVSATLVVGDTSSWLEDISITKGGVATGNGAVAAQIASEPQEGQEVPNFALTNQDKKRIHLGDYRGKALLLTFIYTRCPLPDYCILMSENFAAIDKELRKSDALYSQSHLLSVSFDPAYDTPSVLREYGMRYLGGKVDANAFAHWEFASSTPEETKRMAQFFGVSYYPESGQIIHSLRTAIIAPDGKLYKIYRGNEWRPNDVVRDLETLLTNGSHTSQK
jgi:protein SCO1/2